MFQRHDNEAGATMLTPARNYFLGMFQRHKNEAGATMLTPARNYFLSASYKSTKPKNHSKS
jgi:hypothetical protein